MLQSFLNLPNSLTPSLSAAGRGSAGVRMLQNFLNLPNPLTPTLSPAGRGSALCTPLLPRPEFMLR
jgi:hypothetical protein